MRIAIVGAGAMGSLIGHGLARHGHEVSLIDLAPRIATLRSLGGVVVSDGSGEASRSVPALMTTDFAEPGLQDVVVLATKSQQIDTVAGRLHHLLAPDSMVVTIQNGIPWWYCYRLDHPLRDTRLVSVDPHGTIAAHISADAIVGCVAYPAAEVRADGTVVHVEGDRFPVGELDGAERQRTRDLAGLLQDAGFKSRVITDIRSELWLKAWGALSINPISALTRATMGKICSYPPTRDLVAAMMAEAQEIAAALGVSFRHTIERRIEGARAVGDHKTSMLQDLEAGHPLELDALMGAVLELAELTGHDAPAIRAVHACVALLNEPLLARAGH